MLANYFYFALLVVASLGLALAIKNFKNSTFLFVFIPVVLILCASAIWTINGIMAQPAARNPVGEFQFLEYATDGKKIYMWIVEPGKNYPVTIEMPYDKKKHEELEKARQGKKQGKRMLGKQTDKEGKSPFGDHSKGELQMYEFVPLENHPLKHQAEEPEAAPMPPLPSPPPPPAQGPGE